MRGAGIAAFALAHATGHLLLGSPSRASLIALPISCSVLRAQIYDGVPEPRAGALVACGLTLLGVARRMSRGGGFRTRRRDGR
jgi:hypothetical protein